MGLGLTVASLVLGAVVLTGIVGYLIDHTPDAADHLDSKAAESKMADSKAVKHP